jgi:glycosyltransferase involved in cell wall biosynthesis
MVQSGYKVSVIIPTYNRSKYVTKAIDSVMAQTYKDYEIIVVDDGSTDNTREVLKPYMGRIHYIYQDNAGVSAARNKGIRAAKGEWIAFLDSDDRWHVEKLSMQIDFILKNNIKVSFTDVIVEQQTGQLTLDFSFQDKQDKNMVFNDPFDLILYPGTCPKLSTMIIDKSLLMANDCFDENMKVAEDTKLIYSLALQEKFGYIDCQLTIFNRDENRMGLVNTDQRTANLFKNYHLQILSDAYEKMPKYNKKNVHQINRMLSHYLSLKAVDLCIFGDYAKAQMCALRSCRLGGHYKTYRRALVVLLFPRLVKYFARNDQRG